MQLALALQNDVQKFSGAWNFGPHNQDNLGVHELAQLAIKAWGSGELVVQQNEDAPHEAKYLRLDISKAIGELSWQPRMNVNDAVQRTIQWYKAFYDGSNATDLIEEDLKYYKALYN
jgi:CDP-glucose 4,6-dehydratase